MALINRIKSALAGLFVITSLMAAPVAQAAGTTPLAMVPQVDSQGNQAANCLVYFFVAGTVNTPQNAFQDFGLTQPLANPLSCDQSGRVPMHWLADGLIHIRLTDSQGLQIIDTTMQVLGPSSGGGGGGGGTVDPTTIMATGDMKARYGTGPLTGFVRLNGLTIGSASCGCSERSNADTQALFIYLYSTDGNLPVSGGRSGNALTDFNANKQLTLPDWRGRALAFLDDMGNTPAGRLTTSYFGATATVLGASGGNESQTLVQTQLPAVALAVTGSASVSSSPLNNVASGTPQTLNNGTGGPFQAFSNGTMGTGTLNSGGSISGATANMGSGLPHPIVQPTMLATVYIKL